MLITDDFVFLHNPKTGGTFVTAMLEKVAQLNPGFELINVEGEKHTGVRRIPKEHRHKKVVINVRNPFEHYVSRYEFKWWVDAYAKGTKYDNEKIKEKYSKFPELSFRDFLYFYNDWEIQRPHNIAALGDRQIGWNSCRLVQLTQQQPMRFIKKFDNLDDSAINKKFSNITFLRTENLNQDLHHFLKSSISAPADIDFIIGADYVLPQKGGRGKKDTWTKYFDDELIDFVCKRDRLYFRLFPDMKPSRK